MEVRDLKTGFLILATTRPLVWGFQIISGDDEQLDIFAFVERLKTADANRTNDRDHLHPQKFTHR